LHSIIFGQNAFYPFGPGEPTLVLQTDEEIKNWPNFKHVALLEKLVDFLLQQLEAPHKRKVEDFECKWDAREVQSPTAVNEAGNQNFKI
jgi:hypothetical protein